MRVLTVRGEAWSGVEKYRVRLRRDTKKYAVLYSLCVEISLRHYFAPFTTDCEGKKDCFANYSRSHAPIFVQS